MDAYRSSQVGYPILITAAVAALIVAVVSNQVAFSLTILALVAALFWRLTVSVDRERLTYVFGVGLIRRSVKVEEIVDCNPIRHRWYWGYGIRVTPHGVVNIVDGSQAAQFILRSGRRFSVGAADPEQLCEAVRRVRAAVQAEAAQPSAAFHEPGTERSSES